MTGRVIAAAAAGLATALITWPCVSRADVTVIGGGYAADCSMRRARVGALASVAMAVMILAAVIVPNTIISMLLLVVSMAAPITYGAVNTSLMHAFVPPEQIGRATGIFVGVANVLGGAAPTVVGWLIGIFRGEYLAAFGFIGALNLFQAILYTLLGRREEP